MAEIKFLRGSSVKFQQIDPKVDSYFYLVSNENGSIDLYLGSKLIAKGSCYSELAAEISRSVAEDARLAGLISALEASVDADIAAAVEALNGAIAAEKARAEGQEAAIRSEFAAADATEKGRAEAKEAELAQAIATEKGRAEGEEAAIRSEFAAADAELAQAIATEKGRAEGAEEALQAEIERVEAAAKSYSLVAVTEGLSENVKEAFKLIDEDGAQAGEIIKIYKDSSLISVELKDDQKMYYTYVLANGSEETVSVDFSQFLLESEFKAGLQVIGGEVSVKVDGDSEAFLSVSESGVKLSGVQAAIDAAEEAAKEYADGLDAALAARVKAIEDDYLVAADKEELAQAIADETSRAEGKEGELAQAIADEAALAREKEGELSDAIAAEKERAEGKEGELAQAIADEAARADAAEKVNAAAIAAEIEQRKGLSGIGNINVSLDSNTGMQTIGMVWGEF